jgi:integrase
MIDGHIRPALGSYVLPKLAPLHIQAFYSGGLAEGRKDGKGGLSAQSVVHFHRLLHKAFAQALKWQLLARNPILAVEPPRAQRQEMRALDEGETASLLSLLGEGRLYMPVMLAVTTGLRRGEILGLRWSNVDLATASITVVQSLEQTKEGLRFRQRRTEAGGPSHLTDRRSKIDWSPDGPSADPANSQAPARTEFGTSVPIAPCNNPPSPPYDMHRRAHCGRGL